VLARGNGYTMLWEVEHLAELGDVWVPFSLSRQMEPIGEIHAQTQTIKLYEGVTVVDRQVVVLNAH
jgi:hypothetical protein